MTEKAIDILMEDYKIRNARVEMLNDIYAKTIVEQIIVFGALLSFGILKFTDQDMLIFVHFVCCIALPLVACSIVACTFSFGIKNLSYGEYLYSLEKKIELLLKSTSEKSPINEFVNWESWRLKNGIARDKWVYHDTVYNIVLVFVTSFFIAAWRLKSIFDSTKYEIFWIFACSFFVVVTYVVFIIVKLSKKMKIRRERENMIMLDTFKDNDLFALPSVYIFDPNKESMNKFIKCGLEFVGNSRIKKTVYKHISRLTLNPANNSKLLNEKYAFVIAYLGNEPVGKLLIGTNTALSEKTGVSQGYFSLFDCIDNQIVANEIFKKAAHWYRKKGITKIVGPESCTFDDFSKGLQVFGIENKSFILNPTNPEYYENLLLNVGLLKRRDHYAYRMDLNTIDKSILHKMDARNKKRLDLRIESAKLKRSKINSTINDLLSILSNDIPPELDQLLNPSREDIKSVLEMIKLLTRKEYVKVAYEKDIPIAIMIAIPNYYDILKGNSFIMFFLRFLLRNRTIKGARILFVYIVPKYQRMGILYNLLSSMHSSLTKNGIFDVELSTIDEKNDLCNNTSKSFGLQPHKIYREYEMQI